MNSSVKVLAVVVVIALVSGVVWFQRSGILTASPFPDYTEEAFAQAQSEGKLVAVNFHAPWCGNCKAQEKAMKEIVDENEELASRLVVLYAHFDHTKDLQEKMNVNHRTQVLLFKNNEEVGRIQSRSKDEILSALRSALN